MSVHNKKTTRTAGGFDFPWWAVQDLNLWPPPCKGVNNIIIIFYL